MKDLLFILLVLSFNTYANSPLTAQNSAVCDNLAEDTPVLAGGRIKPYYVLAKESIKFLTGKSKFDNQIQTKTFCQIMLQEKLGVQMWSM